jgi:hypothetical protein
MKHVLMFFGLALAASPQDAFAAIGCTLSNPSEDLKYLYPEMTSFKEELNNFPKMRNGAELFKGLRERLGSDLDPIYESYETPYTVYTVFKGQTRIGIVHGVNVPGKGGVIQVFLSTDPATGEIRNFFFQRLESPAGRALRNKDFRAQFSALTLADFYKHDYFAAVDPGAKNDKVAAIKPPAVDPNGRPDYEASLRGVRKNLVLLDLFVYGRRFEPYFERARQASITIRDQKD